MISGGHIPPDICSVDKFKKTFLSELNTGIIILDRSLKVVSINPSALSFLDTSEMLSIGNKIDQETQGKNNAGHFQIVAEKYIN